MEVKFEQNSISCLQTVVSRVQRLEQTQELRLPEGYPDIGRILGCWGQVLLRGKEWRSSGMSVSAGVMAWVLYAPEDGSGVRVVDAWIPVSCKWELPEPLDDGLMTVQPLLTALDARSTSARKLMLRACVEMMGQGMVAGKVQIAVPVEPPEDVYLRREHYPVELPVEGGEKQIQLEQPLTLPEAFESSRIIGAALKPQVREEKIVANRLIFRGETTLELRYIQDDQRVALWQTQLPFSQYVELDREHENQARAWLKPVVTALELNREENGRLSLKAGLAVQYLILERSVLETVTDAYSPCREVQVQQQLLKMPILLDMRTLEVRAQGISDRTSTIEDVAALPEFPVLARDEAGMKLQLEGHFQCLARDEEGHLRMETLAFSGDEPFSSAAENRVELWLGAGAGPVTATELAGTVLRCSYPVTAMVYAGQPITMVTGLELGEERALDPERPSLILRRAGDEELWTMAKRCGSTVEAIRKANHLQQDPEKGQMLLIPVC